MCSAGGIAKTASCTSICASFASQCEGVKGPSAGATVLQKPDIFSLHITNKVVQVRNKFGAWLTTLLFVCGFLFGCSENYHFRLMPYEVVDGKMVEVDDVEMREYEGVKLPSDPTMWTTILLRKNKSIFLASKIGRAHV